MPTATLIPQSLIDLEHDEVRPVSIICQERTGKRAAPQKVWRWVRRGAHGARLEAVLVNGVWSTTPAAFAAFIRAQTAAALKTGTATAPDAPAERPASTKRRLAAAGLI